MLVTFASISSSLRFQAAASADRKRDFFCALVPVPGKLSSPCGYAAEVEMEEPGELLNLLREMDAEWDAVYRPCGKEYQALYQYPPAGL
ncbi:MAG: DUF3343 domain-containing protein [Treponema sp.]|jgi:hypothetical protein|nr:DUF3343 domain-containing protein [Treponema sp.]